MNQPDTLDHLWEEVRQHLDQIIGGPNVERWFQAVRLLSVKEGVYLLEASHPYARDWIQANYLEILEKTLRSRLGHDISISITEPSTTLEVLESRNVQAKVASGNLIDWYRFESFVVGPSNQLAHAAAVAVSNAPGNRYNPLFFYGGVGLGKTHLINAIGHRIFEKFRNFKVYFISAERFMNELVNSIRTDRIEQFREKYRQVHVLLLDDVQFLVGKERTQEELFHTFNTLYETKRQIVLTSDRFPKDIQQLDERLRSRFEWGLIADIKLPDMETRLAILRKKAQREGIELPDDVGLYVAKHIKSNIRELEGALIRVYAHSNLTGERITLESAREALADTNGGLLESQDISLEAVIDAVCRHFGIRVSEIKSKKRSSSILKPRQAAMYLARKVTQASLPEIGKIFGGKDHTTVMHAVRVVEKMIEKDEKLKGAIEAIEREVLSL
ncbi:MAG: chromosomal replication initiator protein DnaA [Nitrospirota bacterium]|nr:chromosomal replication initiator protein DnaA [Nitrospirota bacterium]